MKHIMKTKYRIFVLLFAVLCSSFLLGGCSLFTSYTGTYQSTFVDSQNDDENISFTLDIKSDKTFVLTRHVGEDSKEYSGYYKSYTEAGQKQLLCVVEDGFEWNEYHPNAWNPYFSVCMLDDGTLMATSGTTSSSNAVATAFGSGSISKITLILFNKV